MNAASQLIGPGVNCSRFPVVPARAAGVSGWWRKIVPVWVGVVLLGMLTPKTPAWGLDLYSDNLGITAGTADTDTTTAQDNCKKIADAMVAIHAAGGGTLYFRGNAGAYRILAPIYPLPNVSMGVYQAQGEDPTTATIKNIYHDGGGPTGAEYWNAPVLYGGYDSPSATYPQTGNSNNYPTMHRFYIDATVYPKKGNTSVRVYDQTEWNAVNMNDEIRIVSGSNAANDGISQIVPNYSFKAIVANKRTVATAGPPTRYWLDLVCDTPDRTEDTTHYNAGTIPFDFPKEAAATCGKQWGSVPSGEPSWYRVKDFYSTATPAYWSVPGQDGYEAYHTAMAWWTPGVTSRSTSPTVPVTFKNLVFWSKYGRASYRSLPCNASFIDCVFKGSGGIYGNSCENTTFTNCIVAFWDRPVEFSYNSQYVTMTNTICNYDPTLNYGAYTPNYGIGLFVVHERSNHMSFIQAGIGDGLNINLTNANGNRTIGNSNWMLQLSGENINFDKITATLPQYPTAVFGVCKDIGNATVNNYPSKNITIGSGTASSITLNMGGNYFNNLTYLVQGSNTIHFQNITVNSPSTTVNNKNVININDNTVTNIDYSYVNLQSMPWASGSGVMSINADLTSNVNNIVVHRTCNFGGVTGAALDNVLPGLAGFAEGTSYTNEAAQIQLVN